MNEAGLFKSRTTGELRLSKPVFNYLLYCCAVPADFNAQKFLASTFGRHVGAGKKPYYVRLRFKKEIADWITEREWHPGQKAKRTAAGDLELQFTAAGLLELKRWVLAWGENVKVLAPAELQKIVSDEIKGMAKIY